MTINERPTPLTDSVGTNGGYYRSKEHGWYYPARFVKKLERTLAERTEERDGLVERFRKEIKQRQETQKANALIDAKILATRTAERDTALAKLKQWESGELRLACKHEHEALDFAKQTQTAIKERNIALAKLEEVSKSLVTEVTDHCRTLTKLAKCRESLDKLHIACETSKPEIYDWYLTDPFASEARENALEALEETKPQ